MTVCFSNGLGEGNVRRALNLQSISATFSYLGFSYIFINQGLKVPEPKQIGPFYNMYHRCILLCDGTHPQWCTWGHWVFQVFKHHIPSLRQPSQSLSDPGLRCAPETHYQGTVDSLVSWSTGQWGHVMDSLYQKLYQLVSSKIKETLEIWSTCTFLPQSATLLLLKSSISFFQVYGGV